MDTILEERGTDRAAYEAARKRVRVKAEFFGHLTAYVVINAALIVINLAFWPGTLWFIWPLVGWGIGIVFHFLNVFVFGEGSPLEERMIERELERHQR